MKRILASALLLVLLTLASLAIMKTNSQAATRQPMTTAVQHK